MTDFITLNEFRDRHGITPTANDARIAEHIAAATGKVRGITQRDFSPHTGEEATARVFTPSACDSVWVDDCYDIEEVAVDDADAGTFSTVWAATDYETDPANGIGPDGVTGWPITTLRAVAARTFPVWNRRRSVRVTAKWGWEAVPADVKEATHLLAHRLYYEVSVPGGVTAPNPEFGLPGSPLLRPYTAEKLLKPYIRADRAIGIAG